MSAPSDRPLSQEDIQDVFINHELLAREAYRPPGEAGGVRTVGILGGGTASWLTALALRAQLPWLDVTVVESTSIPIIGVGEASVPSLLAFLHNYLKLDVLEFDREVMPTWKQGIRFEWGLPGDYVFQAPFDWEVNGVGMLGSMAETGNVSAFTLQAILMAKDVTPILRSGGRVQSLLPLLSFAYHLDNPRLVRYLTRTALARGVHHVDAKVVDAPLSPAPGGADDAEPRVTHLATDDGRRLEFDLYVDCSGFRSFLLGDKLGTAFHEYKSSLYTDSALAFNAPHAGKPRAYTTARTMESGWCWNIPMVDCDHLGYVYSSAHCSDDDAHAEARRLRPAMTNERIVRFRSGRHDRMWVGNVYAIGNAYAFVEPLESTGLLMITRAITSLVRSFPIGETQAVMKRFVNTTAGRDWDRLRWFLAAHYKFNRRLESPFWQDARAGADVSGIEHALAMFRAHGPLSLLPRAMRASLKEETDIFFYGLHGLDCILLGQKVPHPPLHREPAEGWRARRQTALDRRHDLTADDDGGHVFQRRDVPHGISLHGDDVRIPARFEHALAHTARLRGLTGRTRQRGGVRNAALDQHGDGVGADAVRLTATDAAVGTGNRANAVIEHAPGRVHLGGHAHAHPFEHLPDVGRRILGGAQRVAHDDVGFRQRVHQLDRNHHALVGQAGAVLDAVDACGHGALDRDQAVGVRGDGEAETVGLLHDHAELVLGELAVVDRGAGRGEPAAGHDLHDVDAALGSRAHGPAELVLAGRLAAHGPAVALRTGDRRAGADDPLPVPGPLVDHGPLVVTQVPDRGHACLQVAVEAVLDHRVEVLGGERGQAVQRAVLAVGAQMHVGVDQSGQDGRGAEVDDLGTGHVGVTLLDRFDGAVLGQNRDGAGERPLTVERVTCSQRQHAGQSERPIE